MEYSIDDFTKYKQYLNTIDNTLNEYFEDQKEYIFCKKGCAYCCKNGQFPCSELEFRYLLLGFFKIPMLKQQEVIKRIKTLRAEYKNNPDKKKQLFCCPFLDNNNLCTIYEYRPLICRTFGLLTITPKGNCVVPFCSSLGLNYSNVYDKKTKSIDIKKVKKEGYKSTPNGRKTNIGTLTSPEMFKEAPLDFGEIKSLIDWI